jgi:hypothetical protein
MNSILCGTCIAVVILLLCLSMCGDVFVIATLLINSSFFAVENSKMSQRTASWCMKILRTSDLKQEAGKHVATVQYKE